MMGAKRIKSRSRRPAGRWARPPVWFGIAFALILIIALAWGSYFEQQRTDMQSASAFAAWDSGWPPLPASAIPSYPIQAIRAAYAFAFRRPDVVEHLPCYCGCERQGHGSLHMCFVKGRTTSGQPEWDEMGYT
jgi:hypothetical protein